MLNWLGQRLAERQLRRLDATNSLERLDLLDLEISVDIAADEIMPILSLDHEPRLPWDLFSQLGTCLSHHLGSRIESIDCSQVTSNCE